MIHYFWIFLVVPFVGGAFGGFVAIFHEKSCIMMKEEAKNTEGGSQGSEDATLLSKYDIAGTMSPS